MTIDIDPPVVYVVHNEYGYIGIRRSTFYAEALRHHFVEQEFAEWEDYNYFFTDSIVPTYQERLEFFSNTLFMTKISQDFVPC